MAGILRKSSTPDGAPPCRFCQPPSPVPPALRLHPGTNLRQTASAHCMCQHGGSPSAMCMTAQNDPCSLQAYATAHPAAQLPLTSANTDFLPVVGFWALACRYVGQCDV
jgi:hypothetical protein